MTRTELVDWLDAARRCAIVSPNLIEAQTILASASSAAVPFDLDPTVGDVDSQGELQRVTRGLYDLINATANTTSSATADTHVKVAKGSGPIVIVRAGALGSYTIAPMPHPAAPCDSTISKQRDEFHTPAYWRGEEQDEVKDATGGGNGFMGGLCAGMILSNGDVREGESFLSGESSVRYSIMERPRVPWDGREVWRMGVLMTTV